MPIFVPRKRFGNKWSETPPCALSEGCPSKHCLSHVMLGIISLLTQQEDCHQLSHQDHFLQLLCGPWGIQLWSGTDLVWPQRVWGAQHKEISMWATLRGSFIHARLHGSTAMGKRLWRAGSTVGISLYGNHICEDDFTAPSTDMLKQQLSWDAVHGDSTKPMTGSPDRVSYGDALTQQQGNPLKLSILSSLYVPHLLQNEGRLF